MATKNNFFTFLSTAFIVAITGQTATAFTINLPVQGKAYSEYRTQHFYGYTWLALPEPVQRGSSEQTDVINLLNNFSQIRGSNFQFEFAQDELNGSFDFETYYACGYYDKCGQERYANEAFTDGVGASIILRYNPVGSDPTRDSNGQLFWLQRVRNNHAIYPVEQHGINEDRLDDVREYSTNPYYNSIGYNYTFADTPYRFDWEDDHVWDAELYLAQQRIEDGIKKVTIYNGVKWGWRNETFGRNVDICTLPDVLECIKNPPKNVPLDLALVFDTTGSMGSYLNGMKNAFKDLAKGLFERIPGTRIAVTNYKDFPVYPYGGNGDYPYQANLPFSSDITSIYNAIDSLTTGGGGDIPESLWSGLMRTMETENISGWRNGVRKSIIYLTDAPAHTPEPFTGYTTTSVVDKSFYVDPVAIYGIVPSYLASDPELVKLSNWTGGKLLTADNYDEILHRFAEALTDINGIAITPTPKSVPETITPKSVPETMPTYGLLALAVGSIIQKLKTNRLRSKNV